MLLDFISRPIPDNWDTWSLDRRRDFLSGQVHTGDNTPLNLVERQRVSATEFLCEALNFAPKNLSKQDLTRVGKIMRGLQGWRADRDVVPIYRQVRLSRRENKPLPLCH